MAFSPRADEIPQSQQLLQLLNIPKKDDTKADEPVNATDDEEAQDDDLATPRPRNAELTPRAGMYVYDQSWNVFPSGHSFADGSVSTPDGVFVSGPQN